MLDERGPALPTVAVVAADRRVRDSLASLLGASGQVRVIGEAGDVGAALRLVSGGAVEVVVVGCDLANGASGNMLLPQLREEAPEARILLIEWGPPCGPIAGTGADAVLDLADRPSALLDAVLGDARGDESGGGGGLESGA